MDRPPAGRSVAGIAARQRGLIAAAQLRELGLDRWWVRRRVDSGLLYPVYRGVYVVGRPGLSLKGRYLAAVLSCEGPAYASHRSGGHLWALRPNAGGWVEITLPRSGAGPPGIQVHRTRMLAPQDFTVVDGIPVTSVARTLLDLAGVLRPGDLEVAVDRAERAGLFDLTGVVDVLARAKGRKGARVLKGVLAAYETSVQNEGLERHFKTLLAQDPGIPTPCFNALVEGESRTNEVDAFWECERLAAQLDGFEFHRTRRDREKDAASDADLELAGYRVVRLTWDDVHAHGARTLRRLRLAIGVP